VIPNPLYALAAAFAGEDVEAYLRPIGDALRDFDGFMFDVVGGIHAGDDVALTAGREVGVEFEHGGAWGNGFGTVDLDFVIALRTGEGDGSYEGKAEDTDSGEKLFQKMRSCERLDDHLLL
jgi:hypothetical protein